MPPPVAFVTFYVINFRLLRLRRRSLLGVNFVTKKSTLPPAPTDWPNWPTRGMCALIFVVTLIAYLPALGGGFIWDDQPGHVTRPALQSIDGLRRIWFEVGAAQQYYPVLHSAFWLEHKLWGDAPFPYHLLNVLLHATAACLVGVVLRRLAVRGAWLVALLFALHPVCVESVAWVSEQKNTLSAVFYLAALAAYLRFDETRQPRWYGLASVRFVLALLTKTVTATLPAALLVIAWWRRGRIEWKRDVQPVLPWFALSLAGGLTTAWVERTQIGAHGSAFALDPMQRVLLAGRAIWFYLGKLLWPADLIFVYPRWTLDSGAWGQYLFPLGVVALVAAWFVWQGARRGLLAGLLFFAGTLFPALGFVNVYPFQFSFVADHFQYLASLGILTLVAAAAMVALDRWPQPARLGAIAVLAVLMGLTWEQSRSYRSVFTLYEETLRRNPGAWLAHNNLAEALTGAGKPAEAIPHLEAALKLRPDFPEALNNLGDDLRRIGRPQEAVPPFERALKLRPDFAEAHNNLGIAFAMLDRPAEALKEFETALKLKPKYPQARFNLGLALASSNRAAEAIPHFEQAVRLEPNYAEAELNWAIALTVTQQVAQATQHFERALQLDPDNPSAHNFYGRALAMQGRYEEAVTRYRAALELAPNFGEAHQNLAFALRQLGRTAEAQQELELARQFGRN